MLTYQTQLENLCDQAMRQRDQENLKKFLDQILQLLAKNQKRSGEVSTMPAPKCIEHDSPMELERSELQVAIKQVLDMYGCPILGCYIKYAKLLGGYGIFNEGKFVLMEHGKN